MKLQTTALSAALACLALAAVGPDQVAAQNFDEFVAVPMGTVALTHAKVIDFPKILRAELYHPNHGTHAYPVLVKLLLQNLSSQFKSMRGVFMEFKRKNTFLDNQWMMDSKSKYSV